VGASFQNPGAEAPAAAVEFAARILLWRAATANAAPAENWINVRLFKENSLCIQLLPYL
jgi:hypothetical protein